jgi:hypothetical protein
MRASIAVCWVLLAAATARAEQVPVVSLPTILVNVGADKIGWQRAMDDRLDAGIRSSGRAPRLPGPLDGPEAGCREPECMARIAEGATAGIVLGAKIIGDRGSPPSYKIVLTRFDRDRPGTVRQETVDCTVCTQSDASDRLGQMVATMLPSLQVQHPRVDPTPAPTPPPATVTQPPAERRVSRKLLHGAIAASAIFGAAGIGMLGAGGRALAIDGTSVDAAVPPATQSREVYDTRAAGIGLTVAGAMLVVSASIELGFEIWLLKKRSR